MSNVKLAALTSPDLIVDLVATTKEEALRELLSVIKRSPAVSDPKAFEKAVFEREKLTSTGIGQGVAVPHAKIPSIRNYVMAIGRSRSGVEFDSLDGQPARLLFLVGASDRQAAAFVQVLASLVSMVKSEAIRRSILEAPDGMAVYGLLNEWDDAPR